MKVNDKQSQRQFIMEEGKLHMRSVIRFIFPLSHVIYFDKLFWNKNGTLQSTLYQSLSSHKIQTGIPKFNFCQVTGGRILHQTSLQARGCTSPEFVSIFSYYSTTFSEICIISLF